MLIVGDSRFTEFRWCRRGTPRFEEQFRRFLGNLETWGLEPRTIITDGSNLYPAVLAELWPAADHQPCVFHILEQINELILEPVRRPRTGMTRRGRAGLAVPDVLAAPRAAAVGGLLDFLARID